ncbi:hypothetical protein VYU27_008542 [Nannochloropsis oceanica]
MNRGLSNRVVDCEYHIHRQSSNSNSGSSDNSSSKLYGGGESRQFEEPFRRHALPGRAIRRSLHARAYPRHPSTTKGSRATGPNNRDPSIKTI